MAFQIKDLKEAEFYWRTGCSPEGEQVALKDVLSTPSAPMFFPKVISNVVKEAAEPYLIGTSLLQRINVQGMARMISFPAMGATAVANDIPEGGEYPIAQPQAGGGTVITNIGKVGLAVAVTEEVVRYSQMDVIGMLLGNAGRDLARFKETKIFNYIRSQGVPIFNNIGASTGNSLLGVTTGRGMDGQANGSLTLDDLFDAYAHLIMQGYVPNTLLMHPLAWVQFVKDPVLRAFALANGGGTFLGTWQGNPAGRAPWESSSQSGMGVASGQTINPGETSTGGTAPHSLTPTPLISYPQNINSAPSIPSYFGMPLTIVVSPFCYFDPHRKLTDIYIFDRSRLGAILVDEDVTTEEWRDPSVDITKIKLRERYGIVILDEGQAIGKLSNIHVVPNELVLPAQATIQVSSSISPISPTQSISL